MGGRGSGRVPKPENERLGHGSVEHEDPRYLTMSKARFIPVPTIPEPSERWHPIARSWFNSLKVSGQTGLWQASDWTTAVCAAQAYDRFLRTDNASILASFVRLSERLGCTVLDRKRGRVELTSTDEVDKDEERAVQAVISWKGRLGIVQDD